jgi:hypothetical protein
MIDPLVLGMAGMLVGCRGGLRCDGRSHDERDRANERLHDVSPKAELRKLVFSLQRSLGGGVAISGSVSDKASIAFKCLGSSGRRSEPPSAVWIDGNATQEAQCTSIWTGASAGFWGSSQWPAAAADPALASAGALAMPNGINANASTKKSLKSTAGMLAT